MAAPLHPGSAARRLPAPSASASATAPALDRERMEAAIMARARRFSLGALLDALHAIGYSDDDIELRSHATSTHRDSVVDSVRFAHSPRRATVVLNLGLLAPQSMLPSYFQAQLSSQGEGGLSEFLGFFAHRLLRGSAVSQHPERNPDYFSDWRSTLSQLLSMLGLRSLSAVHWVFALSYPELGVSVQRTTMTRPVRTRGVRLGRWAIGDGAVLGEVAQVPVSGIAVKLLSDEPVTHYGQPWARAADERLHEQVFPVLAHYGLYLHVSLILRDQRNFLVLRPNEFLGYTPLYGGPQAATPGRSVRTIILWNDEVPSERPAP